MRRRPFFRALALPLVLWFVALSVNLGGYGACPMAGDVSHGATMAGMAMPAMAMGNSPASTPAPAAPAPRCPGVCCCCRVMITMPSHGVTLAAAVVRVRDAGPAEPRAVSSAGRQVLLPPSNGPPAVHAA
jgi:hypothetical protein